MEKASGLVTPIIYNPPRSPPPPLHFLLSTS
jgi:hypothetical protein